MTKKLRILAKSHRMIVAMVATAAIFGSVYAFAAALGVTSGTLQAGADVTATDFQCDTDGVTPTYDTTFTGGAYKVDQVVVTKIGGDGATYAAATDNPCYGKKIAITLLSGSTVVGNGSATIAVSAAGHKTETFSVSASSAHDIDGVHVVINDGTTS
jgi:hypothetical protein